MGGWPAGPTPNCGVRSEHISAKLSHGCRRTPIQRTRCLIDAPPAKLEVDFNIDVYFAKENVYRRFGDISPVVRTLAHEQFDDYVKRVRIFVHPRIAASVRELPQLSQQLAETIREVGG